MATLHPDLAMRMMTAWFSERASFGRLGAALWAGVACVYGCTNYDAYHGSSGNHGGGGNAGGGAVAGATAAGGTRDASTSGGGSSHDGGTAGQNGAGGTGSDAAPGDGGQVSTERPDAARDAGGGGRRETDGAPDSAAPDPSVPPTDTLPWNDGIRWSWTPIQVCFTASPHQEADGKVACPAQTDAFKACDGESLLALGFDMVEVRARVRAAFENTWQRYGQVEVEPNGWQPCEVEPSGNTRAVPAQIQITFESACGTDAGTPDGGPDAGSECSSAQSDEAPWDEVRGRLGKSGLPTDVHLDWKRIMRGDFTRLVHEFGHALGFRHALGPRSCPLVEQQDYDPGQGFSITKNFDAYSSDAESIMAPCPASSIDAVSLLTGADIAGLEWWYGRKPNGSLVDVHGLCATANAGTGAVVPSYCRGDTSSQWLLRADTTNKSLVSGAPGSNECLDSLDVIADGVGVRECTGANGQQISLTSVMWKAVGGFCMMAGSGGHVTAEVCDRSSVAQYWDFSGPSDLAPARIRLSGTDKCVTAPRLDLKENDTVSLETCSDVDQLQSFSFTAEGELSYGTSPNCLNVIYGLLKPGGLLGFWRCNPTSYNSQFFLSGRLQVAGKCLNAQPDTVTAATCSDAPEQYWDYYPGSN